MPALATSQPLYPRFMDYKDASGPEARQQESVLAMVQLVQSALQASQDNVANNMDAIRVMIGAADNVIVTIQAAGGGLYPRPSFVSAANQAAYETAIDNIETAFDTIHSNLDDIYQLG